MRSQNNMNKAYQVILPPVVPPVQEIAYRVTNWMAATKGQHSSEDPFYVYPPQTPEEAAICLLSLHKDVAELGNEVGAMGSSYRNFVLLLAGEDPDSKKNDAELMALLLARKQAPQMASATWQQSVGTQTTLATGYALTAGAGAGTTPGVPALSGAVGEPMRLDRMKVTMTMGSTLSADVLWSLSIPAANRFLPAAGEPVPVPVLVPLNNDSAVALDAVRAELVPDPDGSGKVAGVRLVHIAGVGNGTVLSYLIKML